MVGGIGSSGFLLILLILGIAALAKYIGGKSSE